MNAYRMNGSIPHEEDRTWLEHFEKERGRPLRVLHVGNVANNAFLNAKALRRVGLDAEVLSDDYYHIMGCPEWEDALIARSWGDDFSPDWNRAGVREFVRPSWFKGGEREACLTDILGEAGVPAASKDQLGQSRRWSVLRAADFLRRSPKLMRLISHHELLTRSLRQLYHLLAQIEDRSAEHNRISKQIVERFNIVYPKRRGQLKPFQVQPDLQRALAYKRAFDQYDLIQNYGQRPIDGFLSGKRPYLAYEHGTLRSIPFEETPRGALTALAYYEADHVFVTNSDNISSIRKLGIENYSFIPHPVNEDYLSVDQEADSLANDIRQRFNASFVAFHPSRQHWSAERHPDWEKGNDIFIRGFARFVEGVDPRGMAIMVEWGAKVRESKELLRSLGCADRVHWIAPQAHRTFVRWIHASDAVADQFFLGAFGSLTPKAMACSKPVLLYLNEAVHRWCFNEMPPVLNVKTPDEVCDALRALRSDVTKEAQYGKAGLAWYRKYHSNALIRSKLLEVYANVLERRAGQKRSGDKESLSPRSDSH